MVYYKIKDGFRMAGLQEHHPMWGAPQTRFHAYRQVIIIFVFSNQMESVGRFKKLQLKAHGMKYKESLF